MGGVAHPRPVAAAGRAELRLPVATSLAARFLRRYQRFFADVLLPDGRRLTVHCPNPGSMLGLDRPGSAVRCSHSDAPHRKLAWTLEMLRVGRTWVGVHTGRANQMVAQALPLRVPRGLSGYTGFDREVAVSCGGQRARLDFRLDGRLGVPAYLEVKSATLAQGRLALFPDSVSERGRRHLEVLAALREQGSRAALLFLVQRSDCDAVVPADAIDPAYGAALRDAARRGVELYALGARVTPRGIQVERELPVRLG